MCGKLMKAYFIAAKTDLDLESSDKLVLHLFAWEVDVRLPPKPVQIRTYARDTGQHITTVRAARKRLIERGYIIKVSTGHACGPALAAFVVEDDKPKVSETGSSPDQGGVVSRYRGGSVTLSPKVVSRYPSKEKDIKKKARGSEKPRNPMSYESEKWCEKLSQQATDDDEKRHIVRHLDSTGELPLHHRERYGHFLDKDRQEPEPVEPQPSADVIQFPSSNPIAAPSPAYPCADA